MRADRLVSLALLLRTRGRMSARALAAALEVSVRTVYRDLAAAHRKVRAGAGAAPAGPALVHLDMPRWFHAAEPVPHLRTLAAAIRDGRQLRLGYQRGDQGPETTRMVAPLGLVNKAGVWYLVAGGASRGGDPAVFRAGRVVSARVLPDSVTRPPGFDLAAFRARWSATFADSLPKVEVRLRASPAALAAFPEVFGGPVRPVLDAAAAPGGAGWRAVTLTFEHEAAAVQRLAGFGGELEVLSPATVRARLIETARHTLARDDRLDVPFTRESGLGRTS